MQRFLNKQDILTALAIAVIGLLAGFALVSLQWGQMDEAMRDTLVTQLGSPSVVLLISTLQVGIISFLATVFGVKLARRAKLELQWVPGRGAWLSVLAVGLAAALVIALSDRLFFARFLPEAAAGYQFSLLYFVSSVLYGGIIEEILLRLFVMSLLVVIGKRLFIRSDQSTESLPNGLYVGAIVIAALIFAALHLPATAQLLGLSVPIVIRAFLLNGLAALGFGFLYWKHGLGSAIAAHILTHVFMQLMILPLVG